MNPFEKAWENLSRNWITALPAIIILAVVLMLFNGLLGVHQQTNATLENLQNKFSITIFLRNDVDEFAVSNLISKLEARADVVRPVLYTSKDQAKTFIQNAFSLNAETLQDYNLSLPPSLTITPTKPQHAGRIQAYVQSEARNLLHDVNASQTTQESVTTQMSEFIQNIEATTQRALIFFIIFFIVAGTLLIASTIYLTLSHRHKEIVIMKLVGAHFGSVSAPYILEGILIALAAYVLSVIGTSAFGLLDLSAQLSLNALVLELAGVLLLGIFVSYLTSYYYLSS